MIVFENNGELDLDAIRAFGVNVKENDMAIGYFGTGLKYAVAICLRRGIPIRAHIGMKTYEFTLGKKIIRGKEFNFIFMNDEQLGFTTELGKNWEDWMAFRELYCNAVDEFGDIHQCDSDPGGKAGKTRVVVEGLDDVYANIGKYILQSDPMVSSSVVEVHRGRSDAIFYRGIRAYELPRPSLFTYNIKQRMALTEDRRLAVPFLADHYIIQFLAGSCQRADVIHAAATADNNSHEARLDWRDARILGSLSDSFMTVMEQLRFDRSGEVNETAQSLYYEKANKSLTDEDCDPMTDMEKVMLDSALSFLSRCGYSIDRSTILFFDSLGKGIHGAAGNGKMILTRAAFRKGQRELVATVLEEYIHNEKGFRDMTREMQTYLFDLIIEQYCEKLGEPL